MAGQIIRVTSGNFASYAPKFSPDGSSIGFSSSATDLVPGDTNGFDDAFVAYLGVWGAGIVRVSTTSSGGQAIGGDTGLLGFSPDGRKLLFESRATNLVPGDLNARYDVFVKDISGTITRVSTDAAGGEAIGGLGSYQGLFSPDGGSVAFYSEATNLVPGDTNDFGDVFLKTLATGAIARVSTDSAGGQANAHSGDAAFSPDGATIAFFSVATNLVGGDTNGAADIFIKTLATGAITRVSTTSTGDQATGGKSEAPSFSPDGAKIAFRSEATNLVAGDTNGAADIFIKDLGTGLVTRVSTSATGGQATGASSTFAFSPDGTKLAFTSAAPNLVGGDGNAKTDVFVKDLLTGAVTRISVAEDGMEGNGDSSRPTFSPDGTRIAFESTASNFVTGDASIKDIFVKTIGGLATGDAGANTLTGGAGDDYLMGLGGDDLLLPGAGRNMMDGGSGQDLVSYAGSPLPVYADLGAGQGYVNGVLVDTYVSVENLTGGIGNDVLIGTDAANVLRGGGGQDQLYGSGGDDRFIGGGTVGGPGVQSQLFGGDGSDTVDYSGQTADIYVDLRAPAGYAAGTLVDLMNSVENVVGGSNNDTLVGTDEANIVSGGGGSDLLFGLGGDDILIGGGLVINVPNQLWGGEGQDTAAYLGITTRVYADLEAHAGYVDPFGFGFLLYDLYNSIENLTGGSAGDTLAGDAGANVLAGAGGADVLYGRGGSDTFVFRFAAESNLLAGYDTIADFETGLDKVDLHELGIDASRVMIASSGGSTSLYADTDLGMAGYELAIAVVGANAVAIGDIVF